MALSCGVKMAKWFKEEHIGFLGKYTMAQFQMACAYFTSAMFLHA